MTAWKMTVQHTEIDARAGECYLVYATNGSEHYELKVTRVRQHGRREPKTKVYVWGEDLLQYAEHVAVPVPTADMFPNDIFRRSDGTPFAHDEVLFTPRKAYPQVDKAWDAHNKAVVRDKRTVAAMALIVHGIHDSVLKWNRRAGCSCLCSPGFIAANHYGYDIYVTLRANGVQDPQWLDAQLAAML